MLGSFSYRQQLGDPILRDSFLCLPDQAPISTCLTPAGPDASPGAVFSVLTLFWGRSFSLFASNSSSQQENPFSQRTKADPNSLALYPIQNGRYS